MAAPVVRVPVRSLRADFEAVFADLATRGPVVWVDAGKQRFLLVNDIGAVREVLVVRRGELVKPRSQALDVGPPRPEPPQPGIPELRHAVTGGLADRDQDGAHAAREATAAETANWQDGASVELMPLLRRLAIATVVHGAMSSRLDADDVARLDAVLRWFDGAPRVVPAGRFNAYSLRRVQMTTQLAQVVEALVANADHSRPSELDAGAGLAGELLLGAVGPLVQTSGWLLYRFATEDAEAERLFAEWPATDRTFAFVREVTRLHPTNPRITRAAVVDTEAAGERVPAGTRVVLNVNAISRNADYYENPNRFLPDRWLDGRPNKFSDLAFGLGERRCLGESFAVTALAALLPAVAARWRLEIPFERATASGRRQLPEDLTARVSIR
ncbi:MAG TPA: cytochrome P450 [Gaiellaceae bacterium]|jgi:cytochrome P450